MAVKGADELTSGHPDSGEECGLGVEAGHAQENTLPHEGDPDSVYPRGASGPPVA